MKNRYLLFTDCHGLLDSLVELLQKCEVKIENGKIVESPYTKIVNLGDYVCKGPQIVEIVDFLYQNQDYILNVIANHEHFVVQYWRNQIPNVKEDILDFFNTSKIEDENLRSKLCDLYDNSVPFVIGPDFVCTHAPCNRKFLLKGDSFALRQQRNYRYTHLSNEQVIAEINDFYDHSLYTKVHCFGHIPIEKPKIGRNFIALDTGAVFGNKLTGLILGDGKPKFVQVDGKKIHDKKLINLYQEKEVNLDHLDRRETRIIKSYVKNKVNFISGTVAPADKI